MVCPGKETVAAELDENCEDWEDENEPVEVELSDSEPSDGSDMPACEDTIPYDPEDFWDPDNEGDDGDLPEIPDSQNRIAISDSDDEDLGSSHGGPTPPVDDGVVAASSSADSGGLSVAQKILAIQKKLSQAKKELTAKNPENIQHYLNNYFVMSPNDFLKNVFCQFRGPPILNILFTCIPALHLGKPKILCNPLAQRRSTRLSSLKTLSLLELTTWIPRCVLTWMIWPNNSMLKKFPCQNHRLPTLSLILVLKIVLLFIICSVIWGKNPPYAVVS